MSPHTAASPASSAASPPVLPALTRRGVRGDTGSGTGFPVPGAVLPYEVLTEESVTPAETVPFLLRTRPAERGAEAGAGPMRARYAVADVRPVTGQSPASAAWAAGPAVGALTPGSGS